MQFTPLLLLLSIAMTASAQRAPPKPQQTLDANTLSNCAACETIVKSWASCQSLTTDGKDCLCTRDWYGSSITCRDCLQLATNQDGPEAGFYDIFEQAITNMVTSCTAAGGSVRVKDGASCAWAYKRGMACISFGEEKSWGTVEEDNGEVTRAEASLKLPDGVVVAGKSASKSDVASSTASPTKSATNTATETAETTTSVEEEVRSTQSAQLNATATAKNSTATPVPSDDTSAATKLAWTGSAIGGVAIAVVMAML